MKIKSNKLYTFFIILFILNTFHINAQTSNLLLNIKLKDANFKTIKEVIEKQTGLSFIYVENISLNNPISINVKQKDINTVLKLIFEKENISFKIINNHIILKREKPKRKNIKVYGYVFDDSSGETLIGANIFEQTNGIGSITNPFGYYCLSLHEGNNSLSFSYVGYDTKHIVCNAQKDTLLNISLKSSNQLKEVIVLSDKTETRNNSSRMNSMNVNLKQINHTPTLLGETDILKSIQLMPGVNGGVNGSSGLLVRGGGPDQNLYLLDGVPIYNVDHTLGFFSIFTPESIKKVELYKGSYPARFGGRLSSIIDIRTNDGDMEEYHGGITIGLLTSKINFEGPIIKGKSSFLISARRSYIDLLIKPFLSDDSKGGYYLYDINAKLNHKLSDNNRLFLSIYNGKDMFYAHTKDKYENRVDWQKENINWGNTLANFRWNHIFNGNLFNNTTVSYNHFAFNIKNLASYYYDSFKSKYKSGITDFSFMTDFDYHPNSLNFLKFGANYTFHTFSPEITNVTSTYKENDDNGLLISPSASRIFSNEYVLYAEDEIKINKRLRSNIGAHLSIFNVENKSYKSIEPRISVSYKTSPNFTLKSSFTKMSQYVNLLSSSAIMLPTDLWVPVTRNIRPMTAYQYSLGGYYTGIKGWNFSIESYYKDMNNVLEYKDGTSYIGSSVNWQDKVEMGKGRNLGIEFMLEKNEGKTTGNISYTLAKADRKFEAGGINNGRRFPYKYDRRHSVKIYLNQQLTKSIDLNATWTFSSGNMSSLPMGKSNIIIPEGNNNYYYYLGFAQGTTIESIDNISHRNNFRLPSSHQLNLGLDFHKKTKHGERIWNLSIINVYNSMNPDHVYIDNENKSDGTEKRTIKKLTLIPLIPSFSYTYKF